MRMRDPVDHPGYFLLALLFAPILFIGIWVSIIVCAIWKGVTAWKRS